MRPPILLLVSLLAPADPVSAQVTVDLRALDALPSARPAATRPAGPVTPSRPRARASVTTPAAGPPASGRPSAAPSDKSSSTPDATLPTGTPPQPEGAAVPTLEANAVPPALPPGAAIPPPVPTIAAAVRVSFGPTQTELGPEGNAIIKQLVSGAPPGEATTFNVVAYAAATPEDPSAARRVSLSRALAVRNALMADGVPSTRIYVRALGGQGGDGPADRADVSVLGGNTTGRAQ